MRIAICMSGQLRNWRIAAENQLWFWTTINRPELEIDYFIHTWDYSGDREGASKPYIFRDISDDEFNEVIDFYKPKKFLIEKKKQEEFRFNDHWSSLFYSFVKTVNFKREYELENGFNYDIVVKTRPDLVFNPEITCNVPKLIDGVIHSSHGGPMEMEWNMYNFDDCAFLANSYTMDLLVNLFHYRQYKIYETDEGHINIHPIGPGVLMHEYFRDYGITPITNLLHWGPTIVKQGCPEDLDLFKPEEFNLMETYFREWYTK